MTDYINRVIQGDSELTAFVPKALTQKLAPAVGYMTPEQWAEVGTYLPNTSDLDPGARKVQEEIINARGDAAIYSGTDDEIPYVEVDISETDYKAVALVNAYPIGYFELKEAALAARNNQLVTNIRDVKAKATIDTIRTRSHLLGALGDSTRNMYGMLNNPYVEVEEEVFNPYDRVTNDLESVYQWITGFYTKTVKATKLRIAPDVMLVPEDLLAEMVERKVANESTTLYDMVARNLGRRGLRDIKSINELESDTLEQYNAHTAGEDKDRFVFYNLNPEYVRRSYAPLGMLAPQLDGFKYKNILYKCVAEPIVYQPGTMRYVKFPKK